MKSSRSRAARARRAAGWLVAACGGTPGEDTDDEATSAAAPATSEAPRPANRRGERDGRCDRHGGRHGHRHGGDHGRRHESTEASATSEAAPAGIDVAAAGDVTLDFASSEGGGGQEASLQALAKEFMAKYPNVTIKESYSAFDPYMKRVKLLAAGDNPPDVFAGNQGYGVDGRAGQGRADRPARRVRRAVRLDRGVRRGHAAAVPLDRGRRAVRRGQHLRRRLGRRGRGALLQLRRS